MKFRNARKFEKCQDPDCDMADEPVKPGDAMFKIKGRWVCQLCQEQERDFERSWQANRADALGL